MEPEFDPGDLVVIKDWPRKAVFEVIDYNIGFYADTFFPAHYVRVERLTPDEFACYVGKQEHETEDGIIIGVTESWRRVEEKNEDQF